MSENESASRSGDEQSRAVGSAQRIGQFLDVIDRVWGEPLGWDLADEENAATVADRLTRYGPLVPELMVRLWSRYGFAGFQDRQIWLCDPAMPIAKILDARLCDPNPDNNPETCTIPGGGCGQQGKTYISQGWIPLLRDGFGTILTYAPTTGEYFIIDTTLGRILATGSERYVDRDDPEAMLYNQLVLGPWTDGYFHEILDGTAETYGDIGAETFYSSFGVLLARHLALPDGQDFAPVIAHPVDPGILLQAALHAYLEDYSNKHAIDDPAVNPYVEALSRPLNNDETHYDANAYVREAPDSFSVNFQAYCLRRFGAPLGAVTFDVLG